MNLTRYDAQVPIACLYILVRYIHRTNLRKGHTALSKSIDQKMHDNSNSCSVVYKSQPRPESILVPDSCQ